MSPGSLPGRDTSVSGPSCDVLVVGGGPAGIGAALGAADAGAQVVLLERYGFLGGLPSSAMVGTICGLFVKGEAPEYAGQGIARTLSERLIQRTGARPISVADGLHALPCDAWAFRCLADTYVRETPALTTILHGTLTAAYTQDRRVVAAQALVWDRMIEVAPKTLVDTTGDATLVALAGGGVDDVSESQSAAAILMLEGVTADLTQLSTRLEIMREIGRAVAAGHLPDACGKASFVPARFGPGRVLVKLVLPESEVPSWRRMSALELTAREATEALAGFLRAEMPAFQRARLAHPATQVGIRAGRVAVGVYRLQGSDVLDGRSFPDGVALGTWPIEQWRQERRPRLVPVGSGSTYEIPLRALRSLDLDNVFVAGRCICADSDALASARVVGTSLSTGWAAGTAAAMQAAGIGLDAAVQRIRGVQVC